MNHKYSQKTNKVIKFYYMTDQKPTFNERVDELKKHLPKRYAAIVMHNDPEIKHSTMYNLLHRKTKHEGVLSLMESLFIKK